MAKILVIEDSRSLCKLYAKCLEEDGHEVGTAEDALEGLRLFDTFAPNLVVIDIRVPAIDGLDAMVRVLDRNRKIPVILNTSYASYKEIFLSWAADAYLINSSDTTELRATIQELLRPRRPPRRARRDAPRRPVHSGPDAER